MNNSKNNIEKNAMVDISTGMLGLKKIFSCNLNKKGLLLTYNRTFILLYVKKKCWYKFKFIGKY